ncbi:hypothetical protein LDL36_13005 [Komagataeibacter sp. FNDCR1]|nr:hypothetical protein [Komagataeibacter sp. FNDCR1]
MIVTQRQRAAHPEYLTRKWSASCESHFYTVGYPHESGQIALGISGFVLGHVTFHTPVPLAVTIMVGVVAMAACNVWRHICDKKVSHASLSGTSA